MTHRGPFQPRTFCDAGILGWGLPWDGACGSPVVGWGLSWDSVCGCPATGRGLLWDGACGSPTMGQGLPWDGVCGSPAMGQGLLWDGVCGCPAMGWRLPWDRVSHGLVSVGPQPWDGLCPPEAGCLLPAAVAGRAPQPGQPHAVAPSGSLALSHVVSSSLAHPCAPSLSILLWHPPGPFIPAAAALCQARFWHQLC